MESTQHTGRISRGWQLTKSSWHVLKLDKELLSLPILSFLVSLIILVVFSTILFAGPGFHALGVSVQSGSSDAPVSNLAKAALVVIALAAYFLLTLVANIFNGAIIYGAIQRFRGLDPTVKGSLDGSLRKFNPLALFSLMMATVGLVLQAIEERVPFVGQIAVSLIGGAWSIANIFAVPVIVLSEENVGPLDATKRSVQVIKKIWGEGVVANLGLSIIALIAGISYFALAGVAGALLGAAGVGSAYVVAPLVTLAVMGFVALIVIFSVLTAIAKAALYHYATTGEAPASFDSTVLRSAMTTKKARKIFA